MLPVARRPSLVPRLLHDAPAGVLRRVGDHEEVQVSGGDVVRGEHGLAQPGE